MSSFNTPNEHLDAQTMENQRWFERFIEDKKAGGDLNVADLERFGRINRSLGEIAIEDAEQVNIEPPKE